MTLAEGVGGASRSEGDAAARAFSHSPVASRVLAAPLPPPPAPGFILLRFFMLITRYLDVLVLPCRVRLFSVRLFGCGSPVPRRFPAS